MRVTLSLLVALGSLLAFFALRQPVPALELTAGLDAPVVDEAHASPGIFEVALRIDARPTVTVPLLMLTLGEEKIVLAVDEMQRPVFAERPLPTSLRLGSRVRFAFHVEEARTRVYAGGVQIAHLSRGAKTASLETLRAGLPGAHSELFYEVGALKDHAARAQNSDRLFAAPPPSPLTEGAPHFFGYYEERMTDATGRRALVLEPPFEGRHPNGDETARIMLVDVETRATRELTTTSAWNWQQGAMMQWRPGHDDEILFNELVDGRAIGRVMNVVSGETRDLAQPIYAVAPDGKWAASLDFGRLHHVRNGYGYDGLLSYDDARATPPHAIWRIDLDTGEAQAIVNFADVLAVDAARVHPAPDNIHYINHLRYNPSGTRLLFFHRWVLADRNRDGRILTVGSDGADLRLLADAKKVSHYTWLDDDSAIIFTAHNKRDRGYAQYDDPGGFVRWLHRSWDGHQQMITPEWMLVDTYANNKTLNAALYLANIVTDERLFLADAKGVRAKKRSLRLDLHPRFDAVHKRIFYDGAVKGRRQVWTQDLAEVWPELSSAARESP